MRENVFLINQRFRINPVANEVWDKEKKQPTRLEPRIMKLLGLLAERTGEVITREALVEEIWGDYLGGNEGLNQAISALRKLLEDEQKTMIKTIPKTGYTFQATITNAADRQFAGKIIINPSKALLIIAGFFLLFLVSWVYFRLDPSRAAGGKYDEARAAEISRMDSLHQAEKIRQLEAKTGKE